MAAYKRRWNYDEHVPCEVSVSWDNFVGAYNLKFDKIGAHWDKVQGIITWIKMTIPSGDREYDDVAKVWTLHEKYFQTLKSILEAVGSAFQLTIFEKPLGGSSVKFVPLDSYLAVFKELSGTDLSSYGDERFGEAKKIYFRTAMKLHPDRHPNDPDAGQRMSNFNEAWDIIKERHFKIVRLTEQIQ